MTAASSRRDLTRDKTPHLTFHPATSARWKHLTELFGDRGACGGCWCMVWRLPGKDWAAAKGVRNRNALRRIVESGKRPGVIGYLDGSPVAWCAVAPREEYTALSRSRVLAPVDEEKVWSISCLFVRKDVRRRGVSVLMLEAAVDLAARRGARIVEGYPVEPHSPDAPAPFIWTGTVSAFRKAGFREALRRSRTRPIMRYRIDGEIRKRR